MIVLFKLMGTVIIFDNPPLPLFNVYVLSLNQDFYGCINGNIVYYLIKMLQLLFLNLLNQSKCVVLTIQSKKNISLIIDFR